MATTKGLQTLRAEPLRLAARAGIALDPWQGDLLRSSSQALLVNCSRQSGKSTVVALAIIRTLLYALQTVVIITPSERQSKELFRKALAFWRRIGRPIEAISVTRTTLELANESRLLALPASESTIRGISAVSLLVADEASRIPDELYNAVSPMLAVADGRLMAPSTPHGKRGWWYDLWCDESDTDTARIRVPAEECPRIPREFLARERRRIGEWWFRQEYGCEFLEAQTAAFRDADVEQMFRADVQPAEWLFAS